MENRLLTADMADKLLEYLQLNFPVMQVATTTDVKRILTETGLEFNELHAFLSEFKQMGLISATNVQLMVVSLLVERKLHAFLEAGGFSGELAKLKTELELLQNKLQNQPATDAKDASTIINNVLQIIGNVSFGLLGKY